MGYIGNRPADSYTSFAVQHFTTSATTTYSLDNPVANENEIALFINNVRQEPGSSYAYTASGTTLTLSAATSASDTMYCVFIGKAVQTVTPTLPIANFSSTGIDDNATSTAITIDSSQRVGITEQINKTVNDSQLIIAGGNDSNQGGNILLYGPSASPANTIIYRQGTSEILRMDSAGLKIGGTGSANALDDYEEGTFTATLRGGTEPGTLVTTTGIYTKVGRQVSFQIDFNGVNTTGYGGAVDVYGLPFANSSSGRAMCSVGMYHLFSFDSANYVVGEIGTNNTIITPQQIRSANSWAACSHNAGSDRYIWITGTYQTN